MNNLPNNHLDHLFDEITDLGQAINWDDDEMTFRDQPDITAPSNSSDRTLSASDMDKIAQIFRKELENLLLPYLNKKKRKERDDSTPKKEKKNKKKQSL